MESTQNHRDDAQKDRFEVFFDGDCPLCKREIALIRRKDKFWRLKLTDIASADFQPTDRSLQMLMRQIHGRYPDGQYVIGVEVFREIYSRIGFERLVAPTRWFIIGPLLDLAYSLFAKLRFHHAMRRIKTSQSKSGKLECEGSCSPIAWEAGSKPMNRFMNSSEKSSRKTRATPGFFNSQIRKRFGNLAGGQLTLVDDRGKSVLGSMPESDDDLSAAVIVSDEAFYRRVFLGGTVGAAESYMDGQWTSDDLTTLIRIMIRNLDRFSALEKGWAWLTNSWNFLEHLTRKNSIRGSRKNIHEHYDLGNDFYQLFLDPTMSYSSGIFSSTERESSGHLDMHTASIRKMDQICRKLQLNSLDHVLEIGTGWGGLAIYMAQEFGCRVTTTTISKEQYRFAVERVEREGLTDRVTVLLKDYRELEGKFDKIVSVEMIEAVGHQYYDEYFTRCSSLLRDDGVMLLQSITIGEQIFDYHIRHVDFIRKYVFPGGCLPSVTALAKSVGRATNLRMLHQEDMTPHYAMTLTCWRREFMSKLDRVRELGYDESFIRLWQFYLCYCEAAFAERRVHNIHVMFAKPKCPIDPAVDAHHPVNGNCRSHSNDTPLTRDTAFLE